MSSSSIDGQELLDRLFGVSPEDRRVLGGGSLTGTLARAQRITRELQARDDAGVLATVVLGSAFFVSLALDAATEWVSPALLVLWAGSGARVLWIRRARLQRWDRVVRAAPVVRTLEGEVSTTRAWVFGYGEVYSLQAELHMADESLWCRDALEDVVINGPVRVFLIRTPVWLQDIPDGRRLDASESVAAVQLQPGAQVERRPPARPPPDEWYRGGPAD